MMHNASACMSGAACIEVYSKVYKLYAEGNMAEAKALFHRLIPYLAFALQHLEVAVHIEKRVMHKRGIFPNSRMRQPTITLDAIYQQQMHALVEEVIALCKECSS